MTDVESTENGFEPGVVDENQHGWAPDAPGTGGAKERTVEGHQKAFEGRDTQEASRGEGGQDPDFPPRGVGESLTGRGEDAVQRYGKEPGRTEEGTQGEAERPVGSSSGRDATSVGASEPIDDDMPEMPTGDQGG